MTKGRILHLSWVAFFLTFVAWFNLAPFNTTIQAEFSLSARQLMWLMIANLALTIPGRVLIGAITDRYGPRRTFAVLLWGTAMLCGWFCAAQSFVELFVSRLLLSLTGAGFVVGIRMMREWYPPERIGLAEGVYAGFGNFGSAAAAMSLPALAGWFGTWRLANALTAALCALWGLVYWLAAADSPGTYRSPKKASTMTLLRSSQLRTLAVSYFVTFGGELAVVSMLPAFLEKTYGLSVVAAGWIASSFAFTNLFARPVGGWLSDRGGRVRTMLKLSLGLGLGYGTLALLTPAWPLTIAVAAILGCSFFVQASEGAAFAIAPFVNPKHSGQIAGMIGAAGNLGSVLFIWLYGMTSARVFFTILGAFALCSFLLCLRYLQEPTTEVADVSRVEH